METVTRQRWADVILFFTSMFTREEMIFWLGFGMTGTIIYTLHEISHWSYDGNQRRKVLDCEAFHHSNSLKKKPHWATLDWSMASRCLLIDNTRVLSSGVSEFANVLLIFQLNIPLVFLLVSTAETLKTRQSWFSTNLQSVSSLSLVNLTSQPIQHPNVFI